MKELILACVFAVFMVSGATVCAKPGKGKGKGQFKEKKVPPGQAKKADGMNEGQRRQIARDHQKGGAHCNCHVCDSVKKGPIVAPVTPIEGAGGIPAAKGGKGNNGVGNGIDAQPPGNPRINDGDGAAPGTPGNKKGGGVKAGPDKGGKGGPNNASKGKGGKGKGR